MFQTLLLVATLGQADPPRVEQPDPPRLARRVAELEGRVQRLETALGIASFPAEAPPGRLIGSTGPIVIGDKPVTVVLRPAEAVQYTAPQSSSYTYSSQATCTGPNCGQATQAEGWYLGKNLGRKK